MRKPKYNNTKIKLGNLTFDSKKERNRYLLLKALADKGLIDNLRTQVSFKLVKGVKIAGEARKRPPVRYVADFTYERDGQLVVEDVKSPITAKDKTYRLKKHLMKDRHNIDVVEV